MRVTQGLLESEQDSTVGVLGYSEGRMYIRAGSSPGGRRGAGRPGGRSGRGRLFVGVFRQMLR